MTMKSMKSITTVVMLSAFVLSAAAVKRDLVVPKLASDDGPNVQGSGSECQWGCDTGGYGCTNHFVIINGFPIFDHSDKQVMHPHWECRFAWGPDNCVALPDVLCREYFRYTLVNCGGTPTITTWTTSSCIAPLPIP